MKKTLNSGQTFRFYSLEPDEQNHRGPDQYPSVSDLSKVGPVQISSPVSWRLGSSETGRSAMLALHLTVNVSVSPPPHCRCSDESLHSATERPDAGS